MRGDCTTTSELEMALRRAEGAIREARAAVGEVYLALDGATWEETNELVRVGLAHNKGVAAELQSPLIHIGDQLRRWRREVAARRRNEKGRDSDGRQHHS